MKAKRFTMVAVLSMALLGLWSCGKDNVAVESVTVRPNTTELTVGSTYQLSAVVMPSDAPQELEWTSSRPSVARVSANGLVTAVAIGECDITVYASNKSDVFHITVINGDPTHPGDPTDTTGTDPQNPSTGGFDQNGASNAVFTVAEGRTVKFSRGNLQYQASTGTWRFAEHQYDYVGSANSNISSSNSGWIDLFGWGTSGWNSGTNAYQPWATSTTYSDYYPGGSYTNNLTGAYDNADCGVYNRISNGGNQAGMWRTLTKDEWSYLLNSRAASTINGEANARYAKAVVNGTNGVVLFPDNFTMPSGMSYPSGINTSPAPFNNNTYTESQWNQMEGSGAIFLPAAGYRGGTEVSYVGTYGIYWSSTYYDEYAAWVMGFDVSDLDVDLSDRILGLSVRLVRD